MNKLKILCFILLIEIFSSLLLEPNFGSTEDDFIKCRNQTDTKQCSSITFETKNFQCCKLESKEKGIEQCNSMAKPIKPAQEELNSANGKIMTKEIGGYNLFSNNSEVMFNDYSFSCQDGDINFKFDPNSYTEEERAKFKSDNHCIYYSTLEYQQGNITREACYNAILVTTGDSGVSCGYYEFKLNLNDSSTGTYKTCFLFNDDILKTKNLGLWTKMMTEDIATNAEYNFSKKYLNYQFNASNSKGEYFVYYSINDTVIVPTDSDEPTDSGKPTGSYFYISIFLNSRFILLLILFLI